MPTVDQIDQAYVTAQERHRKLTTQATRLDVEIEAAAKLASELGADAKAKFGTDDITTLKKMLAERTAANTARKQAFVAAVGEVEQQLAKLQAEFAAAPAHA